MTPGDAVDTWLRMHLAAAPNPVAAQARTVADLAGTGMPEVEARIAVTAAMARVGPEDKAAGGQADNLATRKDVPPPATGAATPMSASAYTIAPEREYALRTMLVRLAERHGADQAVRIVIGTNTAYGGYSETQAAADVHAVIARMNGTWPPPLAQAVPQPPPVVFAQPDIGCGSGSGPEVIRAVTGALTMGVIPQTYVADGQVTTVNTVSGAGDAATRPLGVAVLAVDPALLKAMLARSTYTYKIAKDKSRTSSPPTPRPWPPCSRPGAGRG